MTNTSLFLRSSPFPATPDPKRYIPVGSIEQARVRLMRAIDRDEGPAVLVGPSGSGKTLLCQTLATAYRNSMEVVMLGDAKLCTRRALLQMILFHLNMPYRDMEEGELRLSLLDRLRPGVGESGRDGLLLIVDEAQHLAARLIDELRMIAGVVRDGRPRVRMVLAGNMRFEERLSEPSLESLAQRVAARCYLHPMHLDETRIYLREHFRRIGLTLEMLVEENAIQAVHQAAMGIPRVVNQIMDQAFITAEQRQSQCIDLKIVEIAWAELNQLPAPCVDDDNHAAKDALSIAVVEFGSLDAETPQPSDEVKTHSSKASDRLATHQHAVEFETDPDATVFGNVAWPPVFDRAIGSKETAKESHRECDDAECTGRGCTPASSNGKMDAAVRKVILEENYSAMAFSALTDASEKPLSPVDAISFLQQQISLGLGDDAWSITNAPTLSEEYARDLAPELVAKSDKANVNSSKPSESKASPISSAFTIRAFTDAPKVNAPVKPRLRSHQSANAVFGSDFDEVIELKQPMRVSSTGPLPWQGTVIDDASWLEQSESDSIADKAEGLHQQVLSLSQEAFRASHGSLSGDFEHVVSGSTTEGDDRDMLIVEEEIRAVGPSMPTTAAPVGCEMEYRDLFSRLRQG